MKNVKYFRWIVLICAIAILTNMVLEVKVNHRQGMNLFIEKVENFYESVIK
jgi:predicted outer membrane lipoprotein